MDQVSRALLSVGGAAEPTDPDFENVTMLLPGDGTNGAQNNTFLDSSTNNFSITRNGNTTQGTFSPYGDNWSNYFDGSGDYLTAADAAGLEIGNEDFTIECWVYLTAGSAFQYLISKGTNTDFVPYQLIIDNTNKPAFYASTNGSSFAASMVSSTTMSLNSWNHLAVCRVGSAVTMYLNGTSVATGTVSGALHDNNRAVGIGGGSTGTNLITGYLSNVRIVKGTALYTSNFTPSTTPLTAVSGTSLLTCQSNRFRDASSNNFAITVNGNTSVQRFSPFAPTAAYSAATIGGSGYFDGTDDTLFLPSSSALVLGSNSFCIEFWVKPNTVRVDSYPTVLSTRTDSSWTTDAFQIAVDRVDYPNVLSIWAWNFSSSTPFFQGGPKLNDGGWHHVVFQRSGNVYSVHIDGVLQTLISYSASLSNNIPISTVGGSNSSGTPFNELAGYVSGLRVVIGSAVYPNNFTPPTAPPTAITNTQLLLNFTNAGIIDNAMMNDLETVGNAQISTSVSKWGTGSLKFDGSGDWLFVPHSADQQFGTGPFTIELWVYVNFIQLKAFIGKGVAGSSGWAVGMNASGRVVFYYGNTSATSSASLSASTWTHIAVVREGTGTNQTKIYINGTNDGTATVGTDFNQTNPLYVGAGREGQGEFNGYIDDLRITRGLARYTANFTPPTAAFADR